MKKNGRPLGNQKIVAGNAGSNSFSPDENSTTFHISISSYLPFSAFRLIFVQFSSPRATIIYYRQFIGQYFT